MFPRFLAVLRHARSVGNQLMEGIDRDPANQELAKLLLATADKDWPVTEDGLQRAEWAGELYQHLFSFDQRLPKLYTSSHLRAVQTSAAISKHWERPAHLWQRSDQEMDWPSWNIDPNLCERSWGTKDNLSWGQFKNQYPKMFEEHSRDPLCFRPGFQGSESILDVRNYRAERFFRRLERDCVEDDFVIVISHWDWILACRSLLEDLDPFHFKQIYLDPSQRIHNLDGVIYSRRDMESGASVSSGYPISYGLIQLPFEETPLDQVEPIRWKKIERKHYSAPQLEQLAFG